MKIKDFYNQEVITKKDVLYKFFYGEVEVGTFIEELYGKSIAMVSSLKEDALLCRLKQNIIIDESHDEDYGLEISTLSFDNKVFGLLFRTDEDLRYFSLYITDNKVLNELRIWFDNIFIYKDSDINEVSLEDNFIEILNKENILGYGYEITNKTLKVVP